MSRVGAAAAASLREIGRTPVLVALLAFLPAYLVGLFTYVAPDATAAVALSDGEVVRVGLASAFPAFTTPMAAALLTGVAGLFLMRSSAAADRRLAVVGYRVRELVAARLAVLALLAVVATAVAVGVARLAFAPANPGWYAVAVLLAALVYGAVGTVAGTLLGRLPGVYLVLFGSMIDLFLFQNPLATDPPAAARFLPGHYPVELAVDAGFGGGVDPASAGWSLVVLAAAVALSVVAYAAASRA